MKSKVLLHAWRVHKKGDKYYLPYTHWIYLKEIIKYFDEIIVLAACRKLEEADEIDDLEINSLGNIKVYELPTSSGSYISSVRYFFSYLKAYRSIKDITTYYSRYPTPFGWLQKIYGKDSQRIVHYVGDPEDAAKNNPNFSSWKKKLLISGFFFENALYTWACKGADVYTNGTHLSEKLHTKGVKAIPLISSTLTESDFYYPEKSISPETVKFIYLGYLRTAKGVETAIRAFAMYNEKFPNSSFTIIGTGEFENQLKNIVSVGGIKNIRFVGKIEDRDIINRELREADIFIFASLSEGSPRVILEAMANGLGVISTPVGSLPSVFKDNQDIAFADFNNPDSFFEKMLHFSNNQEFYNEVRTASYSKVKEFTIANFIRSIFND